MDKRFNLAALPKDKALVLARLGGRTIFGDVHAVSTVYEGLMTYWTNTNMPIAVGQPDEEFGELLDNVEKEFESGVNEAVEQARSDARSAATLDRVRNMLDDESAAAWQVFNVLTFMVEAVPDDKIDCLPIRCTLVNLREQMEKLAMTLMDLVTQVENDAESEHA